MGVLLLIALFSALFIADVVFFSLEKYEYSIGIMVASIVGAYFLSPQVSSFVHASWLVVLTRYVPIYILLGLGTAVAKWVLYNLKRASTIREAKATFDVNNPADKQILDVTESARRSRLQSEHEDRLERYKRAQNRKGQVPQYGDGLVDVNPPTEPPVAPVFEPISAEQAAENRRREFVKFYGNNTPKTHKIYSADFTKAESVIDALTPRAKDNVGLITIWIFQWPLVVVDTLITDFIVKLGKHAARVFDQLFSYFSRRLVAHATKGL